MPTPHQTHRAAVIAKRGRSCMYCGCGPLHKKALRLDRKDANGPDEVSNLLVSCLTCSRRRAGMPLADYASMRLAQLDTEHAILQRIKAKVNSSAAPDLSWE